MGRSLEVESRNVVEIRPPASAARPAELDRLVLKWSARERRLVFASLMPMKAPTRRRRGDPTRSACARPLRSPQAIRHRNDVRRTHPHGRMPMPDEGRPAACRQTATTADEFADEETRNTRSTIMFFFPRLVLWRPNDATANARQWQSVAIVTMCREHRAR